MTRETTVAAIKYMREVNGKTTALQMYQHLIGQHIVPRRFDPSNPIPLAGTVFDPSRYRRP